ncbi:hypothetical protein C1I98_23445 [Spongiactinospora gelatinilytica]|uniref:Uncharacterized protein n=1 Tax=Spongiactinospora gelatinilytica TaxID=2666298 RepID=A0A2W2FVJ1_9ACTN|nr:hypothetical protein [Spongiactinospora gelatinilytica]PZG39652.1 hypothetical protein C1I98_23445 [Spongiactinospora gelatinilytica]
MFSTHQWLTLITAALVAAIACGLALAAGASWPTALLTCGTAAAGTLALLPHLLGRSDRKDPG